MSAAAADLQPELGGMVRLPGTSRSLACLIRLISLYAVLGGLAGV